MNSVASHPQLVIEHSKIQLTLKSKVYAGFFILVLSFIVVVLLVSFFSAQKPPTISGRDNPQNKLQGDSTITRLPILMDRVVRDSSAYVYVKPTSIRSELGIPWGKKIGLEEKAFEEIDQK
jgi:hypothetical protein